MEPPSSTPSPFGTRARAAWGVGGDSAQRLLVVFEDAQCPCCRQLEEVPGEMLRRETAAGAVSIEYLMPCFGGPESVRAANALAAAAATGRLDELRREVLASQPPEHSGGLGTDVLLELGARVGLVSEQLVIAVGKGRSEPRVLEADARSPEQDPQGTPAALLGGEPVDLGVPYDDQAMAMLHS